MKKHFELDPVLLKKRYRAEKRFHAYGIIAISVAIAFIVFFFADVISKGIPAFKTVQVQVEVDYSQAVADGNYRAAVDRELAHMASRGWMRTLPLEMKNNPKLLGTKATMWVPAEFRVNQYIKGKEGHGLKEKYQAIADRLYKEGVIRTAFNWAFFENGDSKLPEIAGVGASLVGTIVVVFINMMLAIPIGVITAVYLEEFAPDNWLTRTIEVNINNLAAIPSILFGLLGLAIFINFFGVPRSSALVGGMTLALMTLPIIIISSRAALRSVPNSIREGAFGVGASGLQVVWHHVLPLALPGILTGSIIGLAHALGETAPLLIVGMMAFIPEAPHSIYQAATVLPAQIYTWSADSIRAFGELTAAGVIVLLSIMLMLNGLAIWLRHHTSRTW